MERVTRCILAWQVSSSVSDEVLQTMVDDLPTARWYYSDALPVYDDLSYDPGLHLSLHDKSQTYSVEADNAELRHYLARLARRSRCFSRSIHALRFAVRLFVFCWNSRQLHRLRFPSYPSHLIEFVSPLC